jgi:uncharacterized protein
MVLTLSRDEARRVAIRAQRLTADRPTELLPLIEHLTMVQLDPTAAIAPAADHLLWSRLGGSYHPAHLKAALEVDRSLYEITAQDGELYPSVAMIRPISALPLHLEKMHAEAGYPSMRDWLAANESFRLDILARLRDEGPLLSKQIADTAAVPWTSTGWTHNQNVTRMVEALVARGQVAVAGRIGRQRTFDLAERIYPAGVAALPTNDAAALRDQRRLAALGIGRPKMVGETGLAARVDGSALEWRVDPSYLDQPFEGRTALLSPFDRLIHDRVRANDILDFEYILEMYKPAAARRWGYFALPILHDDRLVGKLDAAADRKAGLLRVAAIHEDKPFDSATKDAVRTEIAALGTWLGLEVSWT